MQGGNFSRFFCRLSKASVCVIGDFMVDAYTEGVIDRISPEAPISILHAKKQSFIPGGAGNVVLNLISLGASSFAIGRLGDDLRGKDLKKHLKEKGANVEGLFFQRGYPTTVKNRLIADKQQILRVDHEENLDLDLSIETKVLEFLENKLDMIDVIAISDYAKGFLTDSLLKKIITLANKKKCPVIIDPKGTNFAKYDNADLIKPNEKEAYAAAGLTKEQSLDKVAEMIFKNTNIQNLIITRSSKGISLFSKQGLRKDFPVHSKEVVDVTGAGDTVLAALSITMANKLSLEEGAFLSNICGARAVQKMGCCQVTLSEVATSLLKKDANNKIFNQDHLFALKQIISQSKSVLFVVDGEAGFSLPIYRAIKQESKKGVKVIVGISTTDSDYLDLLTSLKEVDFVILLESTFDGLIKEINPTKIVSLVLQDV